MRQKRKGQNLERNPKTFAKLQTSQKHCRTGPDRKGRLALDLFHSPVGPAHSKACLLVPHYERLVGTRKHFGGGGFEGKQKGKPIESR